MVKLSELLGDAIQKLAGMRGIAEGLEKENADLKKTVGALQGAASKPAKAAPVPQVEPAKAPSAKPYLDPVAPAQIIDTDKAAPKVLTPKNASQEKQK